MAKGAYIGVDNVARKTAPPYVEVGGVARKSKLGYIGVDNVARECFSSGIRLSDLAVGDSVYVNVNGVPTEFLVVHQGNPNAALYDSSCDGTWLLMKAVFTLYKFGNGDIWSGYYSSNINYYLTHTFPGVLDSKFYEIIKQVKIPWSSYNNVSALERGLSTKVFVLTGYEVGMTNANNSNLPEDGSCLDYFSGINSSGSNPKRITYYNTVPNTTMWGLRAYYQYASDKMWSVYTDGSIINYSCTYAYMGVRPAFILPSDTPIDENFNVIA